MRPRRRAYHAGPGFASTIARGPRFCPALGAVLFSGQGLGDGMGRSARRRRTLAEVLVAVVVLAIALPAPVDTQRARRTPQQATVAWWPQLVTLEGAPWST